MTDFSLRFFCLTLFACAVATTAHAQDMPDGFGPPVEIRRIEEEPPPQTVTDEVPDESVGDSVDDSGDMAEADPPAQRQAAPASSDGAGTRVYMVAVAVEPELEGIAARVGAAARASLRRVEGVNWQGPDQIYLGYSDETLVRLTRARERLDAGRMAYLELQLDRAIEVLEQAVEDFDAAADGLEDPSDLGDALMFLGASLVFEGREREARRVFSRLHVQVPQLIPDPNVFNPDVIAKYEAAAPSRRRTVSIEIASEPEGAIAYVDFLARGRTPLVVSDLPPGEHVVRVSRPGATPFVQTLRIRRGSESVNAYMMDNESGEGLADQVAAIAGDDLQSTDGSVSEVARILALDKIGVIRVTYADSPENVHLELSMFDVASGRRLLRGEGDAPREVLQLEAAVKQLVEGALQNSLHVRPRTGAGTGGAQAQSDGRAPLTGDPLVDESPFASNNQGDDDGSGGSVATKWWFWTIAAVVLAGAGFATYWFFFRDETELGQDPGGQVVFEF